MDNKIVKEVCEKLSLGNIINYPKRIFFGLLNNMYRFDCLNGSYAVKQLLHKNIASEDIQNRYEFK